MERMSQRVKPSAEYMKASDEMLDQWVPACGGYETPFMHNGTEWLYVYNPAREEHGYLNLHTDIVQEWYR